MPAVLQPGLLLLGLMGLLGRLQRLWPQQPPGAQALPGRGLRALASCERGPGGGRSPGDPGQVRGAAAAGEKPLFGAEDGGEEHAVAEVEASDAVLRLGPHDGSASPRHL